MDETMTTDTPEMEEEEKADERNQDDGGEASRAMAFTIDFGNGKAVDTQRYKNLVEKYQQRHRRGQSLSKLDDSAVPVTKKPPLSVKLPRKSSFHSEGYHSSDERTDQSTKSTALALAKARTDLTLPLKNTMMARSFPSRNFDLPDIQSPEIELKDISSPEIDLVSPVSPFNVKTPDRKTKTPEATKPQPLEVSKGLEGISVPELELNDSDNVSEAGTYTIEGDNYTEEEKARMSIDKDFKIEQVSVMAKTEEYVRGLNTKQKPRVAKPSSSITSDDSSVSWKSESVQSTRTNMVESKLTMTQNVIQIDPQGLNNLSNNTKVLNKILFPSPRSRGEGLEQLLDQGCFTSVTASGVLSRQPPRNNVRKKNLAQSEITVETYTHDNSEKMDDDEVIHVAITLPRRNNARIVKKLQQPETEVANVIRAGLQLGRITALPPAIGGISGKNSPTKIPSPVHSLSRPRSRSSASSQNLDLSDSSLETESYLKPTQHIISSLQARLSIDSDPDSDYDVKYRLPLNNTIMKSRPTHVRHNSFDDRTKINKLEHFQNKNLQQGIDQTFKNQYHIRKIQNSPNDSPIRRSSSFSAKNQLQPKCVNVAKDTNIKNSQNGIQRSASTASIRPVQLRRSSDPKYQIGDTESSSEDDFDKNKKKEYTTRYNRAFSLRRARLDEPKPSPQCPNTPELGRKFPPKSERTVSVDRKPRATEVQSRYLNINKNSKTAQPKSEPPRQQVKNVITPKTGPSKAPALARTDTGRFSMRTTKTPAQKTTKREQQGKKQSGGRSNSTLSSREVEFQNWKRRKSYDPMKAAAEGKRKAELAKKQSQSGSSSMTQSYVETQECDSSPSHSGSVHRSQSFHGTAALDQLLLSSDDDDDNEFGLSADEEALSPPTPSPCELSPQRKLRQMWKERLY